MRTILHATVSYGSIVFPAGVCSTGSRSGVELNTIHTKCLTKAQQEFRCPACSVTCNGEDTGKGYKVAKNTYVEIDEEKYKAITEETARSVAIDKFVAAGEVLPQMVEKRYWLSPPDFQAFVRPYELLLSALMLNDMVGLGRARLWGVERPVAVEANPMGLLTLAYLFCADEMTPPGDELGKLQSDVDAEEFDMLATFIARKAGKLEPADLSSRTKEQQLAFIDAVLSKSEIAPLEQAEAPEATVDMKAKLKEMVA